MEKQIKTQGVFEEVFGALKVEANSIFSDLGKQFSGIVSEANSMAVGLI